MCAAFVFHRLKALGSWSPRLLAGLPMDFLVGVAAAIVLGVWPMTWGFKLFWLICLTVIVAEIAWRSPLPKRGRIAASLTAPLAIFAMGWGPVEDQYHIDAVLRDYQSTRDLVAKFQAHDESLKRVVEQYDRMKVAQSLLARFLNVQPTDINERSIEDLKSVLNNFEATATPMGSGLKIKLGTNLYRIIFPVPMRIAPAISIGGMPNGVTPMIVEKSNIGFTVLFLPLSIPVDRFGETADATITGG
jgi:hypothetical protein